MWVVLTIRTVLIVWPVSVRFWFWQSWTFDRNCQEFDFLGFHKQANHVLQRYTLCNKSLPHACQQPPMRFLVFAHLCVGLWHFLHWALGRSGCSRSFRRGTVNDMKNRMGWHPSYIQVGPVSRCQHCLHHRHRCYRKNRNVSTSRSRNEMNTKSRAGPKQYRKIWLEHQSNCHV